MECSTPEDMIAVLVLLRFLGSIAYYGVPSFMCSNSEITGRESAVQPVDVSEFAVDDI
jgi:hypothetical protein